MSFGANVSAHRLDEYLHAARISIEPDRVRIELALTPGMAVADAVLGEIDRNGDGSLAPGEGQAYAWQVLSNLDLTIDGTPLSIELAGVDFPDLAMIRSGQGTIAVQSSAGLPILSAGHHQIFFRNANDPAAGVYLANALVPDDDRLAITAQGRDGAQSELAIDFALTAAPAVPVRTWLLVGALGASVLLGVRHTRCNL